MRRGFTLIEVLVVVAIIALLISILLPSLANARDMAKSVKCLANMRDMGTGVNTFSAGHKGRFQLVTGDAADPQPYGPEGPNADPSRSLYAYESALTGTVQGPAPLCWPAVLAREAGSRSVVNNASWGIEADSVTAFQQAGRLRRFEVLMCPSDRVNIASATWPRPASGKKFVRWYGNLSYGINEDVTGDTTDAGTPVWNAGVKGGAAGGADRLRGQLGRILRPAEVLVFVDMGADTPPTSNKTEVLNTVVSKEARGPLLEFAEARWGRMPYKRHRNGSSLNIAYADGHGGFVKRSTTKAWGTGADLPDFAYQPKTRVSPYASGKFPVP